MQPVHEEMLARMKKEMVENMDPTRLTVNSMANCAASMGAFSTDDDDFHDS